MKTKIEVQFQERNVDVKDTETSSPTGRNALKKTPLAASCLKLAALLY